MTIIQKGNKVKKYFTLPLKFIKYHQLIKNFFTYQRTINNIKIEVTPRKNHLLSYNIIYLTLSYFFDTIIKLLPVE